MARRVAREVGERVQVVSRAAAVAGWASLTHTERMVAELVTQGLTSRVAADRLLLPPHVVDLHLRHIFRKLRIHTRTELARITEAAGSQERTLAAVDSARRRIERDLHDGLQQQLVALGLQVRAAESSVPDTETELKWELASIASGLLDALSDVREIARGIHPAILAERGLVPAVKALARHSPVPVSWTSGYRAGCRSGWRPARTTYFPKPSPTWRSTPGRPPRRFPSSRAAGGSGCACATTGWAARTRAAPAWPGCVNASWRSAGRWR
ncbi:MAG: hypothetical protein JOY82_27330 [Streptosporangiaceae bacterium]|nr:hypothetical protein [Streptosporangiaceae bacterium]